MQIDWTTFVLEIVNFLALVWLLKRFLYTPVLDVLARRRAGSRAAPRRVACQRSARQGAAGRIRTTTRRLGGRRLAPVRSWTPIWPASARSACRP